MSAIFLPRKWLLQPQGAVTVDWRNPLTQDLRLAVLPHVPFELVYRTPFYSRKRTRTGVGGIATDPTDTSQYTKLAPFSGSSSDLAQRYDVTGPMSVMAVCRQTIETNNGYTFLRGNGSSTVSWGVGLHGGSRDGPIVRIGGAASGTPPSNNSSMVKSPHVVAAVGDTSVVRGYYDGSKFYESGAYTDQSAYYGYSGTPSDNRTILVGSQSATSASGANVECYAGFMWARALRPDEVRELADAPYQLFRAPSHRIWFDVGASSGGTTYNESLTETTTAGDALDPLATFFASYAESIAAGDSPAGAQTHAENVSEGVTAGDGSAGAQTMPVAFSEGVTAGDLLADDLAPAGSFNESLTESVTADDAYASAQAHVGTIDEQATAGDEYAASGGTPVVTKRRGAGGSPRGYVARIGGRLVYADTLQALQAAIAQFEASIPARAEKKAQKAGKVVVRRLPKVEVVEAPAEDQGATRAAAQAANERIAAEYIAALQAQIAIRAAMEAAERDDMEAITVLEFL